MALIRTTRFEPPPLVTGDLELRPPVAADYEEWAALRLASRDFLEPWEPTWPADDLTRAAFRRRLRRYQQEARDSEGRTFFLFGRHDETLKGGISLTNMRWGVTMTCSMGYWMGAPYAGRGLMTQAVRAVSAYVFDSLRLHRIEAACLPHNEASKRVLAGSGFQPEGLARAYLRINGRWQDHLLFALLSSDLRR